VDEVAIIQANVTALLSMLMPPFTSSSSAAVSSRISLVSLVFMFSPPYRADHSAIDAATFAHAPFGCRDPDHRLFDFQPIDVMPSLFPR
jgi:hypothetical protein